MNLFGREILAVGFNPAISGEMNAPAARGQGQRQRLRGEQMAAGAAGSQQRNLVGSHQSPAPLPPLSGGGG